MNLHRSLAVISLLATVACAGNADRGGFGAPPPNDPAAFQPVSLTLERNDGSEFPSFLHLGSQYVGGEFGQQYQLRLTNNTAQRVEAVVAVDGRDVISGDLGNYKRQRGYVIEPYSAVVVPGFRQSLQSVAAFRFTDLSDSYSARRGTPENTGVIGVAVFREKEQRKRQKHAYTTSPRPASEPGTFARQEPTPAEPFPGSPRANKSAAADDAAGAVDADMAEGEAPATAAPAEERSAAGGGADGGFAEPPPRTNELGTQYGESTQSSVREIEFKRRKKRKPDAFLTLYYDSLRGLEARGVPIHGGPAPIAVGEPDPFPGQRR